jgi:hypothetical protein
MILTFSKSEFIDRIKSGTKIHTIREDKHNRWKVGNKIHFWSGNPRNTRGKVKPYQFGIGEVSRVDIIKMYFAIHEDWQRDIVYIGNYVVLDTIGALNALAENDGFDNWEAMKHWFVNPDMQYDGKIIFWKNFDLIANNNNSFVI